VTPVTVIEGDGPLVLGQPHGGTWVPDDLRARLNERGRALADTDWHIARLYDGLCPGATIVRAEFHRYVIDANRDPSGASLYPGQNTTGLCPTIDFNGELLYRAGEEPTEDEIATRRKVYHAAYHTALARQLDRVKARHGYALLYDCHSIRGEIPFLFDGALPDFNIGSNDGATCAPALEAAVTNICRGAEAEGYRWALNGRFKGGWTTRHYGKPENGVHAIQMELAQRTYMQECAPWTYEAAQAERLRHHLRAILETILRTAREDDRP
jgi:formiminoglutamase